MARYVDADELFDWIAIMLYLNELDGRTAHKIGSAVEGFIKKHERVELIEDTTIVKDPYGRPGFICSVCGGYFESDSAPDFIYCPLCGRMVQDEAAEEKKALMTKWHEIISASDLPNLCRTVLVELRSGDRQVAQLDINPWTRVPGWCVPNGNWLGSIDIVKRWMEIQD